jgi:hypothetical protein
VSSTLVEEEEISHDSAQGHAPVTTGNSHKPARDEASHRTNGGESDQTKYDTAIPQPREGFAQ